MFNFPASNPGARPADRLGSHPGLVRSRGFSCATVAPRPRPYVLVVEPNELDAFEISQELGREVLVATSLRDAHALIDAHDADIFAIVSAPLLPCGRDFFLHPKTLWVRIPEAARVIVSAPDAAHADPMGAIVVHRPHLPGDIEQAIQRAMREPPQPLGDEG